MSPQEKTTVWLAALTHGLVHAYMLVIPLLIPLWLIEFEVDRVVLGLVAMGAYLAFGLGALPAGWGGDRFGSRRMIVIGVCGMGLGLVLAGFSWDLASLSGALVALGAFASLYHPNGFSWLSRSVRQRGRAFGYHGVGGNVGIALGPFWATLLLLAFPWRQVLWLLTIPAGLLLLGFWLSPRGERSTGSTRSPQETAPFSRLLTVDFALIAGIYLFMGLYYRGSLTFFPDFVGANTTLVSLSLLGNEIPPSHYLYTLILIVGVLGQVLGGRWSDHRTPALMMALCQGLTAITLGLIPLFARSGILLSLAAMAFSVCLFAGQPIQNALVARHSPPTLRGVAYGITFLASFGFGAFGAGLAGWLITSASYTWVFGVMAAFALLGLGCSLALWRRGAQVEGPTP